MALIQPLIPKIEQQLIPTKAELIEVIKRLIPTAIPKDTPKEIVDKLNTTEGLVEQKVIKGLPTTLKNFERALRDKGGLKRGGGDIVVAGDNITITRNSDGTKTIAATGAGHTIKDEGVDLTQRTNLNFVGAGVTVTDDSGNDETTVTIPGGDSIATADISSQFDGVATTFTIPAYTSIVAFILTGWAPNGALRPTIDFTTPTSTTVALVTAQVSAPEAGATGIIIYKTSSGGGGGGSSLAEVSISGTVNDSNTAFTAAEEPTFLVINGKVYKQTGAEYTWSYSGGNITLNTPIGSGGTIFGIK